VTWPVRQSLQNPFGNIAVFVKWSRDCIRRASQDPGFNTAVFADMLTALHRLTDDDIPVPAHQIQDLQTDFAAWANSLR
jgi:hypothetical protein